MIIGDFVIEHTPSGSRWKYVGEYKQPESKKILISTARANGKSMMLEIIRKSIEEQKEKETLKMEDKRCATCKYENLDYFEEPCHSCDNDYSGWVAKDKPEIRGINIKGDTTTVYFKDGTKTSVKCYKESFDPEKGIAMACAKKLLGDDYYDRIKSLSKFYSSRDTRAYKDTLIMKMQNEITVLRSQLDSKNDVCSKYVNDINELTRKLTSATMEIDRLNRVYDGSDARELRARNEDLIKVNDELACNLLKKSEEVIELKNRIRQQEYCVSDVIATNRLYKESEIAELKQKVEDLERENAKLRAENGSLKIDLDRMKDAVKARDEKIDKFKTEINRVYGRNVYAQNDTIKNLNRIVQDKNATIDDLKRQLEVTFRLERTLKAKLTGAREACKTLRDEIDELKRRIKELTLLYNATEVTRCELFREVQKLESKLRDIHDTAHEGLDL